jgi:membrane protein implicated in regulation of membrane protease activity
MESLSPSLLWVLFGILIITGEMLTSGFFLLFVSFGCFAAALVATFEPSFFIQGVTASIVAIIGVVFLRKPIIKRFTKKAHVDSDIGQEVVVDSVLNPNQQARINYQGTTWMATNRGTVTINAGEKATIIGTEGNTLIIMKSN